MTEAAARLVRYAAMGYPTRIANVILCPLLRSRDFREGFKRQINVSMIAPYQKLLSGENQRQD